jgi:hypothetical protein
MTRFTRLTLIVGIAGAIAAAAHADDSTEQRAREALAPFKSALKQALTDGMREGPVAAVETCHVEAPEIAASHSQQGVRVGRASHRLRNPANAPPDWVKPILDAYVADASVRAPQTASLDGGRAGYVEPILVQPLCVTCHGTSLAPDVAARIRSLYPEDAATGFEVGDLRGVWWVELPAAQ